MRPSLLCTAKMSSVAAGVLHVLYWVHKAVASSKSGMYTPYDVEVTSYLSSDSHMHTWHLIVPFIIVLHHLANFGTSGITVPIARQVWDVASGNLHGLWSTRAALESICSGTHATAGQAISASLYWAPVHQPKAYAAACQLRLEGFGLEALQQHPRSQALAC